MQPLGADVGRGLSHGNAMTAENEHRGGTAGRNHRHHMHDRSPYNPEKGRSAIRKETAEYDFHLIMYTHTHEIWNICARNV